MKTSLIQIDQEVNSKVINFILSSGEVKDILQDDILAYIESNNMNVSYEGEGLTSDPYATEVEVIQDSIDYLEDNFESVCQSYFTNELQGRELSHAA